MARILHLVDTSSAVYAGSVNKHSFISGPVVRTANGYRERIIPTGGLSQLFNIVYQYMNTGTIVFCCDRPPTIKRGMFPGYKGNRHADENVNIQKSIVEYVLEDCGFTVLYQEGYEADDLIYSCVQKFKNEYDHIYIHTGDSDLYFLVDDNVGILPTHSRAKTVTRENYEYTVKTNKHIAYNTLSFQKVLDGDMSGKNLPPLPRPVQNKLVECFAMPSYQVRMGDKELMRQLVEFLVPEALTQFDLIYPLLADVPDELYAPSSNERVKGWAHAIRHRKIQGVKMDLSAEIEYLMNNSLYIE